MRPHSFHFSCCRYAALAKLRDARTIPVELGDLREELLDLKEKNPQLQDDLEDLKKRFEAREEDDR